MQFSFSCGLCTYDEHNIITLYTSDPARQRCYNNNHCEEMPNKFRNRLIETKRLYYFPKRCKVYLI